MGSSRYAVSGLRVTPCDFKEERHAGGKGHCPLPLIFPPPQGAGSSVLPWVLEYCAVIEARPWGRGVGLPKYLKPLNLEVLQLVCHICSVSGVFPSYVASRRAPDPMTAYVLLCLES